MPAPRDVVALEPRDLGARAARDRLAEPVRGSRDLGERRLGEAPRSRLAEPGERGRLERTGEARLHRRDALCRTAERGRLAQAAAIEEAPTA